MFICMCWINVTTIAEPKEIIERNR